MNNFNCKECVHLNDEFFKYCYDYFNETKEYSDCPNFKLKLKYKIINWLRFKKV